MIQVNELRIGNLVDYYGEKTDVITIHLYGVSLTHATGIIELDEIEPIPLTPEILEKCWFKKSKNPYWVIKDKDDLDFGIDINTEGKAYLHSLTGSTGLKVPMVIRYLHQLQNLYFSFTGIELEIQFDENSLSANEPKRLH